ncbi:MAG: hypothetical protein ACR2Q4_17025 [Geminicoccaceae bacterium]
MTELSYLFMVTSVVAGVLAMISIWSRRQLWIKIGAIGASVLLLPLAYASFASLLSKPKPVELEWWMGEAEEATVLGSSIQEGEGIFLWLQLAEAAEPRAYVLPWNRDLAEQLQKAAEEAEDQNGQLRMRLPFEPSLDELDPKFYAMPQPAMPPKNLNRPPAKRYQQAKRIEQDA